MKNIYDKYLLIFIINIVYYLDKLIWMRVTKDVSLNLSISIVFYNIYEKTLGRTTDVSRTSDGRSQNVPIFKTSSLHTRYCGTSIKRLLDVLCTSESGVMK